MMFLQPLFRNRFQGGEILGQLLADKVRNTNAIVLALPRGGVPVAYEVARALCRKA